MPGKRQQKCNFFRKLKRCKNYLFFMTYIIVKIYQRIVLSYNIFTYLLKMH